MTNNIRNLIDSVENNFNLRSKHCVFIVINSELEEKRKLFQNLLILLGITCESNQYIENKTTQKQCNLKDIFVLLSPS